MPWGSGIVCLAMFSGTAFTLASSTKPNSSNGSVTGAFLEERDAITPIVNHGALRKAACAKIK